MSSLAPLGFCRYLRSGHVVNIWGPWSRTQRLICSMLFWKRFLHKPCQTNQFFVYILFISNELHGYAVCQNHSLPELNRKSASSLYLIVPSTSENALQSASVRSTSQTKLTPQTKLIDVKFTIDHMRLYRLLPEKHQRLISVNSSRFCVCVFGV